MARRFFAVLALLAVGFGAPAWAAPQTVLFVGNSFTFGAYSPVWRYRAATVTDLNGGGVGGVPALFKLFAEEAGLDYAVSLETAPGIGLEYHWDKRLPLIDKAWDHVLLQSLSTLDGAHPGDPTLLIDYAGRLADRLHARNPNADIRLTSTWSRPDQTYPSKGAWAGKSIFAMSDDVLAGYRKAKAASPFIASVIPVGSAFSRAIRAGVADPDPYDGTAFGQVDLWAYDHYHASAFGYYLEALMIFGSVTGRDPLSLGPTETAAAELGFSRAQTTALQQIAHDELADARR